MSVFRKPRFGILAAALALCLVGLVGSSADAALSRSEKRMALNGVAAKTAAGKATAPMHFRSARGTFRGVFQPHSLEVVRGKLMATGSVIGRRHIYGHGYRWIQRPAVTVPVKRVDGVSTAGMTARSMAAAAAGSCDVLDLVLGPLHLNLLGLNVDLNQVVLHITALPAGGLLGQLLCGVANLLNGGLSGILGQLSALLNQILGQLGL